MLWLQLQPNIDIDLTHFESRDWQIRINLASFVEVFAHASITIEVALIRIAWLRLDVACHYLALRGGFDLFDGGLHRFWRHSLLIDRPVVLFGHYVAISAKFRMELLVRFWAWCEWLAVHASMLLVFDMVEDDVVLFDWSLCWGIVVYGVVILRGWALSVELIHIFSTRVGTGDAHNGKGLFEAKSWDLA